MGAVKYMVPRGYRFDNWTIVDGKVFDSIFKSVRVRGGMFRIVDIIDCLFTDSVFIGVYFDRTSFYRSVFRDVDFRHCRIRDIYGGVFINCRFINCVFEKTTLCAANIPNCEFENCKFKGYPKVVRSNKLRFIDCENPPYISMACPTEGEFNAYKGAVAVSEKDPTLRRLCIVHIRIPADAKRSSAFGRKCRANKAVITGIEGVFGKKFDPLEYRIVSLYDSDYTYRVGDIIEIDGFNEDRWRECAPGFHFFMTKEEARDYTI